ncbi:hypothetical protein [Enterobacter sp.]|uniref:hypothetical protein n=1 Tax=Enterobacter sp. TaxID=42895 RepID=UPI002980D416|nr:hypothetical protein [Enterobacter sp.]
MSEFITQFFCFSLMIITITTMMLLGWPAVCLMIVIIIAFVAGIILEIINI